MENLLVNYSEFFNDDGGLRRVIKDLENLEKQIKDIASNIKEDLNNAIALGEGDEINKQVKNVDAIRKAFEELTEKKVNLQKIEEEYQKSQKKGTDLDEDQIARLTELDKALEGYRTELKKADTFIKKNIKTNEDQNKLRVEAQVNIKKTRAEINKLQKEVIDSNKLSKEESKLLKAKLVLEKQEVRSLDDIRERLSALRLIRNQVNITTDEGKEKVAEYNEEIDDLTETLSDNNDKFIQGKINIGNYEESIVNALSSSDLFKTGLGGLDNALAGILALLFLNKEQLDALEASMGGNTSAVKRFALAFGRLNKVLKASIIGVVILAIATLASLFGNTRAGAIRLEKVMSTLSNVFTVIGRVAQTTIKVIFGLSSSIGIFFRELSSINLKDIFTGNFDISQITNIFKGNLNLIKAGLDEIVEAFENGGDAIVAGLENIDRAFKLEDQVRRLNLEIEELNGKLQIAQSIADDSTKSLATQLVGNQRALVLAEQIGQKRVESAKLELEVANERIKQNILANNVEANNINLGLKGQAFALATLDLAQKRGSELELSNELLDEQQNLLLEVKKAENDLLLTVEENGRKRREIQRDLFEQNLDLLIDLIDTEKNLSEQVVNDVTVQFRRRVNEFNRFLIKFRENAQRELDEFTKFAEQSGQDLDFQIEFDKDGNFAVFVNDTKLSTDNVVELNKQLQSLGLAEIPINRLREFFVETRNGIRDFRGLNKELLLIGVNLRQITGEGFITQDQINALKNLQTEIDALTARSRGRVGKEEREQILKDIEELERKKTDIQKFAEFQRLKNRQDAILEELKLVEDGSVREQELKNELLDIEAKLLDKGVNNTLDALKKANKSGLDIFKQFGDELRRIGQLILDELSRINQERLREAQDSADQQQDQIDKQEERARLGLQNTLAFEQEELARREARIIEQQKRQERLEKVKTIYSSYSNYASRGDENPLGKALRDFAILRAITATFRDGGITGLDGVKTNREGITKGRRHDHNGYGGNLAFHESGEGFLSRKSIANMGVSNFYALKKLTESNQLPDNFFEGQRRSYNKTIPIIVTAPPQQSGMKAVVDAIEKKPVPSLDVEKVVDGVIDIVTTQTSRGKIKRTHNIRRRKRI